MQSSSAAVWEGTPGVVPVRQRCGLQVGWWRRLRSQWRCLPRARLCPPGAFHTLVDRREETTGASPIKKSRSDQHLVHLSDVGCILSALLCLQGGAEGPPVCAGQGVWRLQEECAAEVVSEENGRLSGTCGSFSPECHQQSQAPSQFTAQPESGLAQAVPAGAQAASLSFAPVHGCSVAEHSINELPP